MRLPSLLGHTAQLLRLLWNSPRPSDQLASEYFRAKKYVGAQDRRFISQTVFATLRGHSAFMFCAEQALQDLAAIHFLNPAPLNNTPLQELASVAACCLVGNAVGVGNVSETLEELLGSDSTDMDERVLAIGASFATQAGIEREYGVLFARAVCEHWDLLEEESNLVLERMADGATDGTDSTGLDVLAIRFAMPAWILATWHEEHQDWFSAIELAASMLAPAPLSLRVNTLAATRETVLGILKEQNIRAHAGRLSPDCIIVDKRVNLTQTPIYRDGLIEIQDEASQLAAFALAPEQGWRILDACAGAGGKSLHIATLQRNNGEIIAADIEYQRLKELPFRARRAGIRGITTLMIDAEKNAKTPTNPNKLPKKLAHLEAACDAVLVDAPCSGMGIVRRAPMTKWRFTSETLVKHAQKQGAILTTFASAVKRGGVLIYATCSVMPHENQHVVAAFLAEHPEFALEALAPAFAERHATIPSLAPEAGFLTLLPSVHGSDGFFLARLRREE